MIHRTRKIELTNICQEIFKDLPTIIKGNTSLAALTVERIKHVSRNVSEMRFMTDTIVYMIKTLPNEVKITQGGVEVNPSEISLVTLDPALLNQTPKDKAEIERHIRLIEEGLKKGA